MLPFCYFSVTIVLFFTFSYKYDFIYKIKFKLNTPKSSTILAKFPAELLFNGPSLDSVREKLLWILNLTKSETRNWDPLWKSSTCTPCYPKALISIYFCNQLYVCKVARLNPTIGVSKFKSRTYTKATIKSVDFRPL